MADVCLRKKTIKILDCRGFQNLDPKRLFSMFLLQARFLSNYSEKFILL